MRSHKDLQNFFIQSLSLCTRRLFSMLLNGDIVHIKKPDGIYLPTSVVDEFPGSFLHLSIFSIKHSLSDFLCWLNSNILTFKRHDNMTKIFFFRYFFMRLKCDFCSKRMNTIQTIKNHQHFLTILFLIMQLLFYRKIVPYFSVWVH